MTATITDYEIIEHLDFEIPCESVSVSARRNCPNNAPAEWVAIRKCCVEKKGLYTFLCDTCLQRKLLRGVICSSCATRYAPAADAWISVQRFK